MKKFSTKVFVLVFVAQSLIAQSLYSQAPEINPADWPAIKGLWNFENTNNLLQASFGTDLSLTGTHTSIPGPNTNNLAVNIGIGNYYTCYHNIPANGGGTLVNEYTFVIDFRAPVISPWYCFYQTNATNLNDGELFINPSAAIGRATNGPGYTDYQVIAGEWYRLVITSDLGSHYKIYLDGVLVKDGGSLAIDGDYALYPSTGNNFFYFFADNDGEDAPIDIAMCAVFQGALTLQQVELLGGYGHNIPPILGDMLPYLQTPTPNSMYISWHCDTVISTQVNYGTTPSLTSTAIGAYENIGGKNWHTVKLENLLADQEYFYTCISGSKVSELYSFRTPPLPGTPGKHVRFLVFGDNQTNSAQSRFIAQKAKQKMQELYGNDIQNHINLIMNHGDIVGDGSNIQLYENEYFKPFSSMSGNIPSMVSIGNHEGESNYFYQYMKYTDLIGSSLPNTERYYTFRLGSCQFIALNTNYMYQNSAMETFLINQLEIAQADPTIDFIFIYGHHPPYSELWPDGNSVWVQEHVIANMKNFSKASCYFSGHTHAYENAVWESNSDAGDFRAQINGGAGGSLDRWNMYPNQTDYAQTQKSIDHYHFTLFDIDVDNHSYSGSTYSMGNPEHPLNCVLIDSFHRNLNQAKPDKPIILSQQGNILVIDSTTISPFIMQASAYTGPDSLMTAQYQMTSTPGNYINPMFERKVDAENWYGDSGSPLFNPIDLNQGIDLTNISVTNPLIMNHPYGWRVRYRDNNLRWSEWSDEAVFTLLYGYTVQGVVKYDNTIQSSLSQVVVNLVRNDTVIKSDTTDNSGQYTFTNIQPGVYQILCSSTHSFGGVASNDALLVLKHFVGMTALFGIRKKAGDVDANLVINAVDALAISKRFVNMINSFPAGDWTFEKPQISVLNSNIVLNIKGLCTGDVNGSYFP